MTDDDAPIVVGVDGSDPSIEALRRAAAIGGALGRPLVSVTSWEIPAMFDGYYPGDWSPEHDAELIASGAIELAFGAHPPAGLRTVIREGGAAHTLIEESAGAYMLVVGSRGHGGVAGVLLGSVSAACAERAHCPVLIMHGGPRAHSPGEPDGTFASRDDTADRRSLSS